MKATFNFHTTSMSVYDPTKVARSDLLFYGDDVDQRGEAAIRELSALASTSVKMGYLADKNTILIDGTNGKFESLITMCRDRTVRIETTTMGLAEILRVTQACKEAELKQVEFVYVEPEEYSLRKPAAVGYFDPRDFVLTKNRTFSAVRSFAFEHNPEIKEHYVFLLGFESARLVQAVTQKPYDLSSKFAVIGVPPFQAGWETNTLAAHVSDLEEMEFKGFHYCAANSAREAYLTLWKLYNRLSGDNSVFVVSPLGTKPHAVGAALFLIETKAHAYQTALYYDHPERPKDRSKAVGNWHFCRVTWP